MTNNRKLTLDIQELPRTPRQPRQPRSGSGRRRLALWLVVLMAAGAGGLWLARDPALRDEVVVKAEAVSGALTGVGDLATSVASSARQLLGGGSATPPPVGQSGTGVPGSSAGAVQGVSGSVQGQTAAPGGQVAGIDGTAETAGAGQAAPSESAPAVLPPEGAAERGALASETMTQPLEGQGRQDDAVVKVAFIVDLAKWMVDGYQPSPNGRTGTLTVGVQGANLRYGAGMRGLSWIGDDLPKGRTEAIRYVYTPGMLDGLYKLYITRFMAEMAETVDATSSGGKALSPAQKSDLYRSYAKRFRGLSGALQSVGAMQDFAARMDGLKNATQSVVEANARYSELVFELDNARELKQTANIERLNDQSQRAGQSYQQAVIKREQVREAVVATLRQNPAARLLDDDTLLFVAHWAERRVRSENPETAMDATLQAATLFLDLAARFEVAAGAIS